MNPTFYYAYNRLRSLNYFAEYTLMRFFSASLRKAVYSVTDSGARLDKTESDKTEMEKPRVNAFLLLDQKMESLFRRDADNISKGIYPPSVLKPESFREHAVRLPRLMWDGIGITLRRSKNKTKEFRGQAQQRAHRVPEYYRRNFHFQTDGYLSEHSARLYDHQVEMLFAGAADAMRRLMIPPLKRHFKNSRGEGLHFLELAAGTGRSTRFLKLAFPEAQVTVVDLSGPYLKLARQKLADYEGLNFVEALAEELPFRDQQFDAVLSTFLFHELPADVREKVIQESRRVLKENGFLAAVDSIQLGDIPEFDSMLKNFPREFHEPFYANYIQHPLRTLFGPDTQQEVGFLSQVVWTTQHAAN